MRLFFLLTFSCIITQLGFCQNELPSFEDDCITFELKSDTLFSNKHVKLFIGAKVRVGSPAYESGYFASIIPKKAAIYLHISVKTPSLNMQFKTLSLAKSR